MDSLTIEGKEYVSSKRASDITGYAKDYIGQLCREGRVEARLVGRNWYISEASLKDHRFGPQEPSKVLESPVSGETVVPEDPEYPKYPKYQPEVAPMLPELSDRASPEDIRDSEEVTDMQSAWKEWFRTRHEDRQVAPVEFEGDAEAPPTSDILEGITLPDMENPSKEEPGPEESETFAIHIEKLEEPAETGVSEKIDEPERTLEARRIPQEERSEKRAISQRASTYIFPRVIFGTLAILSVIISIIGIGTLNRFIGTHSIQASVVEYISGTAVYEKTSK